MKPEILNLLNCPITQKLMEDPVIAADGYTYDRAAIEAWFKSSNKSPINEELLAHKNLTPNILARKQVDLILTSAQTEAHKENTEALLQNPSNALYEEIVGLLNCSIGYERMEDPVTTTDGHTYDRATIEQWFEQSDINPMTNKPLKNKKLTPNLLAQSQVDLLLDEAQIDARKEYYKQREQAEAQAIEAHSQLTLAQLQTEYHDSYNKLVSEYGYREDTFLNPLTIKELERLLSEFEAFERLILEGNAVLAEIGSLEERLRGKSLRNITDLAMLVIEAKIPFGDIPEILNNDRKFPDYSLFSHAKAICQLVAAGLSWEILYNLPESAKGRISHNSLSLCEAMTQEQMPLDRFLELPSNKMCVFVDSLIGINALIHSSLATWDQIFSCNEKAYAIIDKRSASLSTLLKTKSVTLEFLLALSSEDLNFLTTNSINIACLVDDNVLSIEELLTLESHDRDFLIKYNAPARGMYNHRVQNKNPADIAVNLPQPRANRARWAVDVLKSCLQEDGSFKNLSGVHTRQRVTRNPHSQIAAKAGNHEPTFTSQLREAVRTRHLYFKVRPKKNGCSNTNNHVKFAKVAAYAVPATVPITAINIAALSGVDAALLGKLGILILLAQEIPVGGQIALAAVFGALALVGLGYCSYKLAGWIKDSTSSFFSRRQPAFIDMNEGPIHHECAEMLKFLP